MKNFLTKYLGILGLAIYFVFATIVRIPVGAFLACYIILVMLVWSPITRHEPSPRWLNNLYDWYWGK